MTDVITIRSVNRGLWRELKVEAVKEGVTLGERRQQGGYSHKPEEYIWYDFAKWFNEK